MDIHKNGNIIDSDDKKKNNKLKFKSIKNLVLSGGGVKGVAHVGAMFALKELGILDGIKEFAGTSAGSLAIAFHVIGFSPAEIFDFIKMFDLDKLKNINIENLGLLGLDTGSRVEFVIKEMIKTKGLDPNITLKELYIIKGMKVTFTTVCVNDISVSYKNYETDPDLPLYLAVRMSLSIPIIYTPINYKGLLYVDGGCFDNYPIQVFKSELDKTLGIFIYDSGPGMIEINDLETYIIRVLQCVMYGLTYSAGKGYIDNTIKIDINNCDFTDYKLSNEKKDELFITGYKAVYNNINNFIIK